jgi:hypothetical protein
MSTIQNSFVIANQIPPAGTQLKDFDYLSAQLSACRSKISVEEGDLMKAAFAGLVAINKCTGRTTEADMDEAGVPTVPSTDKRNLPKDQRALLHQRACVVSMSETLDQYDAAHAPPELRKEQQALDKAAKKALSDAEKEAKRQQKVADKEAKATSANKKKRKSRGKKAVQEAVEETEDEEEVAVDYGFEDDDEDEEESAGRMSFAAAAIAARGRGSSSRPAKRTR